MNDVAAFLRENDTATYRTLLPALNDSVIAYLSSVLPPKDFGRAIDNAPKRFLTAVLGSHLRELLSLTDAALALSEFAENPILQLADHSDLLLDVETFFHSWFHHIAARARNLRFLFAQQCSRTRLCHSSDHLVGPGYLRTDVDVLNVFALSKKSLRHYSAATLRNVRLQFVPMGICQPSYSHPRLPELLEPLLGSVHPRATVAVREGNAHIWSHLCMKAKKRRVQFDEDLTCDVLRAHIGDSSSLVHRVLFSAQDRSDFLRCRDDVISSAKRRFLKNSTDFFWYVRNGELRPVRIHHRTGHSALIDGIDGTETGYLLRPEEICAALERRSLYPDLIMTYGILSILPGVIALGGPTQHECYPAIVDIFDSFSGGSIKCANEDAGYSGSRLISGLLDVSPQIRKLIGNLSSRTDLDAFENATLDVSLQQALGSMSYFAYLSESQLTR